MAGKPATSASYRIPVSSEYHQNCISGAVKVIRETIRRSATDKTFSQVEYRNCNAVAQEALWKEYVRNEIRATKDWEKDWGFLLEYDFEGKPQQKKQLPVTSSLYSSTFPMTTYKQFGQPPERKEVRKIEKTNCHKKRKTDLENYYSNSC